MTWLSRWLDRWRDRFPDVRRSASDDAWQYVYWPVLLYTAFGVVFLAAIAVFEYWAHTHFR
jgi:hypothetical protein